jgi:DNA-binding transcriptional LysR family regulator
MDQKKAQTLISLSKTKSYTKTAEEMGMTGPAIKKQIENLENYYQCKIIKMSAKKVLLTEKGIILLEQARKFSSLNTMTKKLVRADNKFSDTLTINLTPAFLNLWIAPKFNEILNVLNNHHLTFYPTTQDPDFKLDILDLSIRTKSTQKDITSLPLCSFYMNLYASQEYINDVGTPNYNNLDKHTIFYFKDYAPYYEDIDWHEHFFVDKKHNDVTLPSTEAIYRAVESGAGIGCVSELGVSKSDKTLIRVFPELQSPKVELFLNFHKKSEKKMEIKTLYSILKNILPKQLIDLK